MKKPTTAPEKATRATVDTIIFTPEEAESWPKPDFQRPVTVNEKVVALSEAIKADGGVVPGVLTFGILKGDKSKQYLIDGQQRRQAFLLSEKAEGLANVRICFFDTMAEMAQEFVHLQSHLVNMKPDDTLRALEVGVPAIALVRKECPFVGYDSIRRGPTSPLLSMSVVIRAWSISAGEVPACAGGSSSFLATSTTEEDAAILVRFLNMAYKAWGRDVQYQRLWASLNLSLCMWMFRRLVIMPPTQRVQKLTDALFCKCLMALSASEVYLDWLVGRHLGEHDRSPAYTRIKMIFAKRLHEETGTKPALPSPTWAPHTGTSNRTFI